MGDSCIAADNFADRVQHFDSWYTAMATSPRRDEIVQRYLGLPAGMLSGSLLPWDGIADVVDLLGLPVPATLVDLACGRGGYGLEVAARTGASLIGVDFSVEAIRQASVYADSLGRHARFVIADIATTGLPTASADGVMCIDAVHIVSEPAAVFAELRRILRPGGRAVVTNWEARDRDNDALPGLGPTSRLRLLVRRGRVHRHRRRREAAVGATGTGTVRRGRRPRPGRRRRHRGAPR